MLVFSNGKKIELLPALPVNFEEGEISGIATQSLVDISISWNKNKAQTTIFAKNDASFMLRCIAYPKLDDAEITNGYISISMKAGETRELTFYK
jgi:hypothetical protein